MRFKLLADSYRKIAASYVKAIQAYMHMGKDVSTRMLEQEDKYQIPVI